MSLTNILKGKIVIMRENGYSLKEISQAVGVPVNIIKDYLKRRKTGRI